MKKRERTISEEIAARCDIVQALPDQSELDGESERRRAKFAKSFTPGTKKMERGMEEKESRRQRLVARS